MACLFGYDFNRMFFTTLAIGTLNFGCPPEKPYPTRNARRVCYKKNCL